LRLVSRCSIHLLEVTIPANTAILCCISEAALTAVSAAALHAINRFGLAARPGELQRVLKIRADICALNSIRRGHSQIEAEIFNLL
jgi:hypothetical protein